MHKSVTERSITLLHVEKERLAFHRHGGERRISPLRTHTSRTKERKGPLIFCFGRKKKKACMLVVLWKKGKKVRRW